jgi:ribosome-binding protein aMBF1 (putative translation factor)
MAKRTVAVNDRGYRVGEDHQAAVLTDAEVELVRELREAGGWTYDALAEKFGVGKSTVADICTYRRRAQAATGWKEVRVSADEVGET